MMSLTWFDMGGVIAIAGHRTTYLGPFRRINDLHQGDKTAFLRGDQWTPDVPAGPPQPTPA